MAIAASTVWEVRTGGAETNGGGYSSGGTDYSQQTSAQLSVTDGASSSTTNLNSATGGFTSAMVGNVLCISGGTLTTGRYQITAYVDTNNVTLDRALNTGSGSTVKVGGAVSAPEHLDTAATYPGVVPGNIVYISSDVTGTADGTKTSTRTLTCDGTITGGEIAFIGYPSGGSRTDQDVIEADMPVYTSATNSVAIFTLNAVNRVRFRNIKCTHTAATRGIGFTTVTAASYGVTFENCIASGCLSGWSQPAQAINSSRWDRCVVSASTSHGWRFAGAADNNSVTNCIASGNAGAGFTWEAGVGLFFTNCVATGNTGANGHGFWDQTTTSDNSRPQQFSGCVSHGNAQSGWRFAWTTGGQRNVGFDNCIAYGNTAYGVSMATAGIMDGMFPRVRNMATGSNTSGARQNFRTGEGAITLTADPFTNAAGGDFSLNNTSGGGDLLRGLGYPTEIGIKGSATATYPNVGASTPQATTSTGGAYVIGG